MLKKAKADLAKSGISVEEAEYMEMFSVKDASKICDDFQAEPALVIPYVDPWTDGFMEYERDGEIQDFMRVRYYKETPTVQGFTTERKKQRYSQPQDSGLFPYFPIVDTFDWVEIAEDVDIPIIIVEGEKKAACGCLMGLPTIGIGGVYNFARDGELLPHLKNIEWEDRDLYIAFDNDIKTNNKIVVAESRLATEMSIKHGANVKMVRFPDKPDGDKVGLDDFYMWQGEDAFIELLRKAPDMRGIDKAVLALNRNLAWIEKEGMALETSTNTWIKKDNLKSGSKYSSETIQTVGQDDKIKTISVATAWLTHPLARRYSDVIFCPSTEEKAVMLENGAVAYNLYQGLKPIPGDVEPFFKLYDYMMSKTDEFDHDLIWKLMAYKVQNLDKKINLALVLLGSQGGGKTLLGDIFAGVVSPYDVVIGSDELDSPYNGWMEQALVVVMNEAKAYKLTLHQDKMKKLVTDPKQRMNEKYRVGRQIETNFLMVFTSNERSAGAFPDDDRRFIVLDCPGRHEDGDDFYRSIWEWYHNDGPKKLLNFFLNYDLKGWEPPHKAPETREKIMAREEAMQPIEKIGKRIVNGDIQDNVIERWILSALDWANSEEADRTASSMALAARIRSYGAHLPIRDIVTAAELEMLMPAIATELSMGRTQSGMTANNISKMLRQLGVPYLKCKEDLRGFKWKGQKEQYLVIANLEKYKDPISQKEFEDIMTSAKTVAQRNRMKKEKEARKRTRSKSKRKLDK